MDGHAEGWIQIKTMRLTIAYYPILTLPFVILLQSRGRHIRAVPRPHLSKYILTLLLVVVIIVVVIVVVVVVFPPRGISRKRLSRLRKGFPVRVFRSSIAVFCFSAQKHNL